MFEFEYTLKKSVEYDSQGQKVSGDTIVVSAPGFNTGKWAGALKKILIKVGDERAKNQPELSEKQNKKAELLESQQTEEEKEMDSIEGMIAGFLISNTPWEEILSLFEKIMISGESKFEDGIKINKTILEKFSFDDIENLLGRYATFFLMKSQTTGT